MDRVGFRYCYSWAVYAAMLRELQREYGVRTVLLMTDDSTGKVLQQLPKEKGFNWAYLDFPRQQFVKKGWMEFRSDLDENVPFSLAAAFEMLGGADMLVGNMGSHVTRVLYNKMVSFTFGLRAMPDLNPSPQPQPQSQPQPSPGGLFSHEHDAALHLGRRLRAVLRLYRGLLQGRHPQAQPAHPRLHPQVRPVHGGRPVLLSPRLELPAANVKRPSSSEQGGFSLVCVRAWR